MTLEQAIEFCLHMKEEQYKSAHNIIIGDYPEYEATPHFRLASEYKQIAEWLMELKEAKRLLKAAFEDLNATATEVYNGGVICKCCKWESQIGKCSCPNDGGCDTDYQWRYADEALKLIES